MSELPKNQLLEEFQAYLAQVDVSQIIHDEQPDLNALLKEMAALSSEVKTQSRHYKSSVDTLGASLTTAQANNQALTEALAKQSASLQQLRVESVRPILLSLVDIYDRLTVGFSVLENYHPESAFFGLSKKHDARFIESFREGQAMIIKRFEQLLQNNSVYAIETLGKLIDPRTMSAVDIGHDAKLENGTVLEELRKGFVFEDQVLRVAEVKVNKLG